MVVAAALLMFFVKRRPKSSQVINIRISPESASGSGAADADTDADPDADHNAGSDIHLDHSHFFNTDKTTNLLASACWRRNKYKNIQLTVNHSQILLTLFNENMRNT